MRGIPGLGAVGVEQPLAVMMADHRRALTAARPVVTRPIFPELVTARKRPAIGLRTSQDIVHIRGVPPTVHRRTLLGQRRLLIEIVGAVQFVPISRTKCRDDYREGYHVLVACCVN